LHKIPAKPVFLGKYRVDVPECHSTNTYLTALLSQEDLVNGSLVITPNQTAGRGQRGNAWIAEPGKNLTFSVLLKPVFLHPRQQFYLTMAVALAMTDTLAQFGFTGVIKWPNDILISGKKVAGILIENQITGDRWSNAVVGIGLNVNQQHFSLPQASSLSMISGNRFALDELLTTLLVHLETRYDHLRHSLALLKAHYLDKLYLRHVLHDFESAGEKFAGVISDVDEAGRLLIQKAGNTVAYDLKEIRYL
jgi:BirA family biotin operon repressor/biotin-[acetyl-CoA-carboxylase] ligase